MLLEIALVGAISGLVQGLSGFAFGLIATSLWAWMMAPQQVVPLVVLGSLLGQCISILSVRNSISVARVSPFVVGGAVGVPLGAAVLHAMNAQAFRASVGVGLIVFCTLMLRADRLPKVKAGRPADGCIGFLSGTLAAACGMGGPPMTLWCALRDWDMTTQRATFQSFFIVIQVQVLAWYVGQGVIDRPLLSIFAVVAPVIVAASWIGSRLARRFSDRKFQRMVFLLLLASGLMLLAPTFGRGAQALMR